MTPPERHAAPTPAQRRALLEAIENGGVVQHRVGASASRLRVNLMLAGWTQAGRITDAGRRAVGRASDA